jgi:tetraacyldisaccharide 4'-kinase
MRAPEFWTRDDYSARAISAALSPLAWLYGASVAYKRDHVTPWRSKASVVCVGNLTAGGSGKTPVAIAVARALLAKGLNVSFLIRGYGGNIAGPVTVDANVHGAHDVGDEALLLAAVASTIVSRDRKAGAMLADAQGANIIVMDDGHQNFSLTKDLSIIAVDAESGFGNDHVLPAGPLREPVPQGLSRADAVVLVGNGAPKLQGFRGPLLRARLSPTTLIIGSSPMIAFAGIGRPAKFISTLNRLGANIVGWQSFADHHPYTRNEISRLRQKAAKAGAILVTTEKDYVRLNKDDRAGILALPVRAMFETPAELDRLLDTIVKPAQIPA